MMADRRCVTGADTLTRFGVLDVPSKKALIRRPSPRLAEGLVTHIEREKVDLDLALEQWEAYAEALRGHGWETVEVDPADDCPDSVFVEDTVVMYKNVALIARSGAESRRDETLGVEEAVARLGCSVNWIWDPGTLDGGDVLKVGDTIYVGRGGRTNAAGCPAAAGHLRTARGACRRRTGEPGAAPEVGGDGPARRDGHRAHPQGGPAVAVPALPVGP